MENIKETKETSEEFKQLISFVVGREEYGLEILRVKEVIRTREITWIPQAPTFIKGVINLRGEVIPIFDLRDRFGLDHTDYTSMTRVIVVETGGRLVGIVVDEVSQVILIPAAQIEPPPNVVGGLSKEYIVGVGKIGERLIVLLKIDKILSQEYGEKGEEEVTEITVKREETA